MIERSSIPVGCVPSNVEVLKSLQNLAAKPDFAVHEVFRHVDADESTGLQILLLGIYHYCVLKQPVFHG